MGGREHRAAIGMLGLTILFYGSAWPTMKVALHASTPFAFATVRGGIALGVGVAFLALRRRLAWPGRADWPVIASIGILQIGAFFALATTGLKYLPAGRSAVLAYTVPLWVVPLGRIFLGERLRARQWLGFALGMGGLVLLIGPWSIDWGDRDTLVGTAMMLGAALAWALGILHVRGHHWRLSPLQVLPWQLAVAFAFLALGWALIEPEGTVARDGATLGGLLWLGSVVGPIGSWTAVEVAKRLPASVSSLAFLGTPVFGTIASALWLGERIGPDLIGGGGLVLAGAAIMLTSAGGPASR